MTFGSLSVSDALGTMESLVKRGDIAQADCVGNDAAVPLSLPVNAVDQLEEISQGAESRVFGGTLGTFPVAVKKPVIRNTMDLDRFRQEIKILSVLDHDNVVPLLGARMLPPNYFMVMPNLGENMHSLLHTQGFRPSWSEIIDCGIQLACAVEAVHEAGIVHRDLKTKNVMRGDGRGLCLVDFGVATYLSDVKADEIEPRKAMFSRGKPTGGFHKRRMVGTLEYMAPEILQKEPCSFASDVYALAVTINELATGLYPFSDCTKDNPDCHTVLEMGYGRQELAGAVAAEGLRPTLPKSSPEGYSELMTDCWNLDPAGRPTISRFIQELKGMRSTAACVATERVEAVDGDTMDVVVSGLHNPRLSFDRDVTGADASVSSSAWKESTISESKSYLPVVGAGGFASAGRRGDDKMEDRLLVSESFMDHPNGTLLGVYDGHRGFETAQFAVEKLPGIVAENFRSAVDPEMGFKKSYLQLESQYERSDTWKFPDPKGTRFPGCTALTALVWWDKLVLANAGDCRAVLCRDGKAVQLTRDHTAMNCEERLRVEKSGGKVQWTLDSWRVGSAGIQVTRSLGDIDLKSDGVTAEPEVSVLDLTPHDEFLILATDGLWDTLTNADAVSLVQDTVKHPDMCSKRLVTEAIARGSHDNVSVIVAFLQPVSTIERVYHEGSDKYDRASSAAGVAGKQRRADLVAADEMMDSY
ncbi:hypothetical protein BSKO_08128 [Bryopsis sp. KO-2023]|nr:hypothetical protein BSKO_08128 [Bryopsis sp. KO-2023]